MANKKGKNQYTYHPKEEPKLGTKAFAKLQKQWYDKLSKDGFDDIEWVDHNTGFGQGSGYLKRPAAHMARKYSEETADYFRLCRNFITHYPFKRQLDKKMFALYTDGETYQKITDYVNSRLDLYKRSYSIFYVHQRIKKLNDLMFKWNTSDIEGLLVDDRLYPLDEDTEQ